MNKIFLSFLFIFILIIFPTFSFAQLNEAERQVKIEALFNEGVSSYKAGDFSGAKEKFESVLEIDPTYEPARSKIRLILLKEAILLRKSPLLPR